MIRFCSTIIAISFIFAAYSAEDTACIHKGRVLSIGETVYIQDPVLVADAAQHLRLEGNTEEQIKKYIKSADWVGYVLKCVKTFKQNQTPITTKRTDVLHKTGTALVLISHQQDWYENLKEER
ncbi:MAG: hypothetical protein HAW67_00780 [Endozoicomonadaceae bacterium]|nr:hypothetical protein [Endozoicomonadaceae bacterium]